MRPKRPHFCLHNRSNLCFRRMEKRHLILPDASPQVPLEQPRQASLERMCVTTLMYYGNDWDWEWFAFFGLLSTLPELDLYSTQPPEGMWREWFAFWVMVMAGDQEIDSSRHLEMLGTCIGWQVGAVLMLDNYIDSLFRPASMLVPSEGSSHNFWTQPS